MKTALHILTPGLAGLRAAEDIPSASIISRLQPVLDGALAMQVRRMLAKEPCALYFWADSSPQLSYNFLMISSLMISEAVLVEAFCTATELAGIEAPDFDDEPNLAGEVVRGGIPALGLNKHGCNTPAQDKH